MKRRNALLILMLVLVSATNDGLVIAAGPIKLRVLCSIYPVYLFTRQVTLNLDHVQVDLMLPPDSGCPHDYTLTPWDWDRIAASDVLVVHGAGLEKFLGPALRQAKPGIKIVEASKGIGDLIFGHYHRVPYSFVPLESNQGPGPIGPDPYQLGPMNVNPHLFASPRRAAYLVRNIVKGLSEIDPAGAVTYSDQGERLAYRLEHLANDFLKAAKGFRSRKIVMPQGVFAYLAQDVGLIVVAELAENPDIAPTTAQMSVLKNSITAEAATAIFITPQYPDHIWRTLAREVGIPLSVLDPVAAGPGNPTLDHYELVMGRNLATMKAVLGNKGE